jgi:O-acetyl-ADP-ribose deacetylase (regulator of RNase III)
MIWPWDQDSGLPLNLEAVLAVITSAGDMKAGHIIHAAGPKFQEEDTENKLKLTIKNALKLAEERGIKSMAFPPMGSGFYGVPIDVSARITIQSITEYLNNGTGVEEVVICAMDSREYESFQKELKNISD